MARRSTPSSSTLPLLRRRLHLHLQLLILPAIILALVAILTMKGCAAKETPAPANMSAGSCWQAPMNASSLTRGLCEQYGTRFAAMPQRFTRPPMHHHCI